MMNGITHLSFIAYFYYKRKGMKTLAGFLFLQVITIAAAAQPDRWQQRVKYTMNIDMNVETNRFTGTQKLEYSNNSPDTLNRVFYHLYWNAFQPGSMMDVNSRKHGGIAGSGGGPDWDDRVMDRILKLKDNEIGYQKILSLKMNGRPQKYEVKETILEVTLDKPILPKSKVIFDMEFEAQVPLQIRRSGRDNPTTGVRYSMSQWYPKLCEYDYEGWHPTPYVAREFYGVWGDFDVNISIDKDYTLGGTGYIQNPNEVGHGYETGPVKASAGNKITWKITAPNVHDFMWAADPLYKHISKKVRNGLTLHAIYKAGPNKDAQWGEMLATAEKALPVIEKIFGPYPYNQFSFIDGGDGGMEYPMSTLLAGPSAWLHEWMHSWFYGVLATNEGTNAWMDEGFADYGTARVRAEMNNQAGNPLSRNYSSYFNLVKSEKEEPLITHSDHFLTNYAYGAVYTKGSMFLEQLGYITGESVRDKILLEYYRLWRFKHPNATDFLHVAEKVSNMKLDWFKEYWINSTRTIDYAIDSLWEEGGKTKIRLRRDGEMPMPIDLKVTFRDSTSEMHYVPLDLMYGEKPAEDNTPVKTYPAWKWTSEKYVVETSRKVADISEVEIDPSQRLADVERRNNRIRIPAPSRPF
jgi:hypothetical protein